MRKLRKWIVTTAWLMLLAASLAACGSNNDTAAQAEPSAPASAPAASEAASEAPASPPASAESQAPSESPSPAAEPSASASHAHESMKASSSPSSEPSAQPSPSEKPKPPAETEKPSPSPSPSPSASEKPAEAAVVTVEIKNFAFSPAEITIRPGDKVTFINRDAIKHTATADDGSFDTGLLGKDEAKTVTFDKAGTFGYYCTPHPDMTGTIVVRSE